MIHGTYLISIVIATVFGWAGWAVVLTKLSPFSSTYLSLSLFYASLFVALSGTLTLINYFLRVWLNKIEIYNKHLNTAVRQGCLLSLMVSVGLGFQRLKVLTWWDGLLLLAIVLLVEFYFLATE